MRITLKVDGIQSLDAELLRFTDRIQNATPAFEGIADMFAEAETQRFDSEGDIGGDGGKWSPLAASTVAFKLKHFPGTKILERTGALRQSLTSRPFGIEIIGPQAMRIGTDTVYARFHQDGTSRMPRRSPLALSETRRRSIVKIVQRGAGRS